MERAKTYLAYVCSHPYYVATSAVLGAAWLLLRSRMTAWANRHIDTRLPRMLAKVLDWTAKHPAAALLSLPVFTLTALLIVAAVRDEIAIEKAPDEAPKLAAARTTPPPPPAAVRSEPAGDDAAPPPRTTIANVRDRFSPAAIFDAVKDAVPASRDEVAKRYRGVQVDWTLPLYGIRDLDDSGMNGMRLVSLYAVPDGGMRYAGSFVVLVVPALNLPAEILSADSGDQIRIRGRIGTVDALTIKLDVGTLTVPRTESPPIPSEQIAKAQKHARELGNRLLPWSTEGFRRSQPPIASLLPGPSSEAERRREYARRYQVAYTDKFGAEVADVRRELADAGLRDPELDALLGAPIDDPEKGRTVAERLLALADR